MQVTAFSTPRNPDWRWRIVNYAGEILEESRDTSRRSPPRSPGDAAAAQLNVVDRSTPCAAGTHERAPAFLATAGAPARGR